MELAKHASQAGASFCDDAELAMVPFCRITQSLYLGLYGYSSINQELKRLAAMDFS